MPESGLQAPRSGRYGSMRGCKSYRAMPTTLPLGGALTRVLLVLAVFAACPSAVEAQRDPDLNWRTLDGPHFIVHYHIPLGRLARRVLATAERAHATVAEIVGYER